MSVFENRGKIFEKLPDFLKKAYVPRIFQLNRTAPHRAGSDLFGKTGGRQMPPARRYLSVKRFSINFSIFPPMIRNKNIRRSHRPAQGAICFYKKSRKRRAGRRRARAHPPLPPQGGSVHLSFMRIFIKTSRKTAYMRIYAAYLRAFYAFRPPCWRIKRGIFPAVCGKRNAARPNAPR